MKKVIIYTVAIVTLLGMFAFILKSNKEANAKQAELASVTNEYIPVEIHEVKREQLGGSFKSTGNFQAESELDFASEISGRITSILVEEGSYVNKGQLLARTDDKFLLNELATIQASFNQAKTNKERFEHLIETGGITQTQLEDVSLNYQNAQARLENIKLRIADTYIKAPISGIINARYIETGSYLSPGTKMFNIVDTRNLELVVNVTESQVLQAREGETVHVVADALPNQEITGKVKFIGVKADNSLSYQVKIAIINDSELTLKAGMFGTAIFDQDHNQIAMTIPRSAIFGSVQNPQVYVVDGQKAVLTSINIGKIEGQVIEVKSGLNVGQRVVVSGQINLENGTKVTIIES